MEPLERNVDCNSGAGIPAVVHVVAAVYVRDINVVIVVPVGSPVIRPRINRAEPVTVVLEARISADHQEGQTADAEAVV
jgi:hypothetical protein